MAYTEHWWDELTPTDCIPYGVWNELIDYISCPTSASTGFKIYSDCSNQNEPIFQFDYTGTVSRLFGGDDTGDDMKIFANSYDSYPYIALYGDDYIELDTSSYILFEQDNEQIFLFTSDGSESSLYGSDEEYDNLFIYANSNADCSVLELYGNGDAKIKFAQDSIFEISTCSDETMFTSEPTLGANDFHCKQALNFVVECRTDDPASPCVGQIWFRTDLI